MRFIELPSADERDHLVVNVDAITYIRVIHNTETGSDRSSTVTRFSSKTARVWTPAF